MRNVKRILIYIKCPNSAMGVYKSIKHEVKCNL